MKMQYTIDTLGRKYCIIYATIKKVKNSKLTCFVYHIIIDMETYITYN